MANGNSTCAHTKQRGKWVIFVGFLYKLAGFGVNGPWAELRGVIKLLNILLHALRVLRVLQLQTWVSQKCRVL